MLKLTRRQRLVIAGLVVLTSWPGVSGVVT
jgi:hypothetical protein